MPFGSQLQAEGLAHFRLWAPSARSVELCLWQAGSSLDSVPEILSMQRDGNEYSLSTHATAGSHYLFQIDAQQRVPDPASRFQPRDVHGPSQLIDPLQYQWQDSYWHGRPWQQTIIYELHVGSFSPSGDFAGVMQRLDYLQALGITALELMPIADFPGRCNWGYDGVYQYAPDSQYGTPEQLKALIDAAHARGLMVFLDVVYNHFGPEGNYLHTYAKPFFKARQHTPWGPAINLDDPKHPEIREFFIHNALYWLEEYHFDGLRFDAVQSLVDNSDKPLLMELSERVRQHFGAQREIHLMLENDANQSHLLGAKGAYSAQWNDDLHHVLHHLATAERFGYYQDYTDAPMAHLARCLTQGFAYQGEYSSYRQHPRGEPSADLSPLNFIHFLQNHDHVGNRPLGERLGHIIEPEALRALIALSLLLPMPPLLFMGEEWNSSSPFPFFNDFESGLKEKVAQGRRRDLAHMQSLQSVRELGKTPDPGDPQTFTQARLDWQEIDQPEHQIWLGFYRQLLELRQQQLQPYLCGLERQDVEYQSLAEQAFCCQWTLTDNAKLKLYANLSDQSAAGIPLMHKQALYLSHPQFAATSSQFPPWFVAWFLTP